MIEPSVRQLLEAAVDSPIKLQLLLLFHEDQRLCLSAPQIANRIYRDIWSTREALAELVQDGVLSAEDSEEPRYLFQPRAEHREAIDRLAACYNEPLARDTVQAALREVASHASHRRTKQITRGGFELQMI